MIPARTLLSNFDAALFDLDGVLTPTAEVHQHAWAQVLGGYLAEHCPSQPYTSADYFAFIDGKPRYDGVRALLASRSLALPDGVPSDSPEVDTVCGLGNRKNQAFAAVLASGGVQPYPGSAALLDELADLGIQVAVVSSSANATEVLRAAGLLSRFPVIIDGAVAAAEGLPGKPAPDTFVRAAARLGVPVQRAAVIEDAVSGVRAGKAGGFGLVIGVDRGAGPDLLLAAGADLVVSDLAELLD
ncbi:HAD superfamily hydrolase (TIGR01509 family)/beta-phosphoglucomutase family hydrolase [Propionicimonas paludicola]|uniref:HAD superfamily hydrolase (TIGR01509 family)/beta-phosphoglucomutase family hydrolase n=1 Tax=Propionicimonas paludicola TaxID=185243 RepID=A0A2A9CUM3_9ACTN|nr:HAD-IA family hydrolase [Propionicimonas paludicola]PFG17269.1 HAD superfamily hydrolase (TIGR01509 family)/beta-phosphoglucomutase family hydrolase [Propionicimonas paludicola]